MLCAGDIHSGVGKNDQRASGPFSCLSRFLLTKVWRLRQGLLRLSLQLLPKQLSGTELTWIHKLIYHIKFKHRGNIPQSDIPQWERSSSETFWGLDDPWGKGDLNPLMPFLRFLPFNRIINIRRDLNAQMSVTRRAFNAQGLIQTCLRASMTPVGILSNSFIGSWA